MTIELINQRRVELDLARAALQDVEQRLVSAVTDMVENGYVKIPLKVKTLVKERQVACQLLKRVSSARLACEAEWTKEAMAKMD